MEIETGAQQTIETLPVIETEEELQKYLGSDDDGAKPAAQQQQQQQQNQQQQQQQQKAAAPKKPNVIGEFPNDGDEGNAGAGADDDGNDDGQQGKSEYSKYPSLVHYLNDVNELGLNIDKEEQFSPEQQAEIVSELYRRLVDGTNQALRQQQQEFKDVAAMMTDPEFAELIEAKKAGKGLKDLYQKFAQSPISASDDALAVNDFKKRYPKSSEEAINAMVDSLKKSGQFDSFVKGLREQYEEDSRAALELEKKTLEQRKIEDAKKAQQELQTYASYLGNLTHVHGVPITDEMKDTIWQISTQADENGQTELDRLLQSDEGTVLASIGIALLKDIVAGAGSLTGNRKNNKLMSKLFDSADKLQSGGSGAKTETNDDDYKLLDQF